MSDSKFTRGSRNLARTRRRGTDFLYLIAFGVSLVAPMLFVASKQSTYVNLGYRITELRDRNADLREEQAQLQAEVARLERPDRVFRKVVEMGLVALPANQLYRVHVIDTPAPIETGASGETLVASLNRDP